MSLFAHQQKSAWLDHRDIFGVSIEITPPSGDSITVEAILHEDNRDATEPQGAGVTQYLGRWRCEICRDDVEMINGQSKIIHEDQEFEIISFHLHSVKKWVWVLDLAEADEDAVIPARIKAR